MTEKVIELTEVNKSEEVVHEEQPKPKPEHKIIEAKAVAKLSEEERLLIVNDFKAGNPQPNYTVKELKGGGTKIVPNKNKPPAEEKVADKPPVEQKVSNAKFTNEQMMMQQIMDLNNKMDRMMSKHKKLKKKYKKMKSDIYVDVDELPNELVTEPPVEQKVVEEPPVEQKADDEDGPEPQPMYYRTLYSGAAWRRNLYI